MALKRVDLPTLGRPTMPQARDMVGAQSKAGGRTPHDADGRLAAPATPAQGSGSKCATTLRGLSRTRLHVSSSPEASFVHPAKTKPGAGAAVRLSAVPGWIAS